MFSETTCILLRMISCFLRLLRLIIWLFIILFFKIIGFLDFSVCIKVLLLIVWFKFEEDFRADCWM